MKISGLRKLNCPLGGVLCENWLDHVESTLCLNSSNESIDKSWLLDVSILNMSWCPVNSGELAYANSLCENWLDHVESKLCSNSSNESIDKSWLLDVSILDLSWYPVNSPTPIRLLLLVNSPTWANSITIIGEFVAPHSCVKCVCSAPDSRMIAIADTNEFKI